MKRIILSILFSLPILGFAQGDYSKDVQSVESIINALYEVISGEAGTPRDWARFKNLFIEQARLIPTGKNSEGKITHRVMSPDDYVQMFTTRISTGFFERELSRVVEEYGTIVHVFSTYETYEKKNGPVTQRGINSIQLLKTSDRYYVVNIFWCPESVVYTIPDKYLK